MKTRTTILGVLLALGCMTGAWGATNLWQAGAAGNASAPGNWSLGRAPIASDDILLDGTSTANLVWDAAATNVVASWTQTPGYTGTVTFQTVYGTTGFTNFMIAGDASIAGGKWQHADNAKSEVYRLSVSVGGDFNLAGATISGDWLGWDAVSGPGAPPGGSGQYEGGTHGGIGGLSGAFQTVILNTYGSIAQPVNLGSSGQNAPGGGAVRLTVAGTTTIAGDGVVSVEGSASGNFGGGAGGSIWLTTGWLEGFGTLRANGATTSRGNGGGGRVSIVLTGNGADSSSWQGTNTAYGGKTADKGGAAGTVHRETASGWKQLLIVNNGLTTVDRVVTRMTESPAIDLDAYDEIVVDQLGILGIAASTVFNMDLANVTAKGNANSIIDIGADDNVTYPADWVISNVTVRAHGVTQTLGNVTIANSGVLSHQGNAATEACKLNLVLSGNLTVLSNGVINADGRGYAAGKGPGGGASQWFGGAHAGVANTSPSYGLPTTNTYGSITEPVNLGSGGNVSGGGAVILDVAGTTTVALGAKITANGIYAGSSRGGGAGGSVNLKTAQLLGDGVICADGNGSNGGGGGRVAIALDGAGADFATWTGLVSAYGGAGGGGPGTVYLKPATGPDRLIIDNNGQATVDSAMARMTVDPPVDLTAFDSIEIRNRGIIGIVSNTVFNFDAPNVVSVDNVNTVIDILGDTHVTYPADWVISNITVRGEGIRKPLQNVTIENTGILSHQANVYEDQYKLNLMIQGPLRIRAGGQLHANGKGFRGGKGPGAGSNEYIAGAHGGAGNSSSGSYAKNLKTYGSVIAPVLLGSGGGNPNGGGAIRLNALGGIEMAAGAVIAANGADWASSRGGGSGGSLWITTSALAGDGTISANGGYSGGGGGRVSVELTSGTWDDWTGEITARGGTSSYNGAAGTVRWVSPESKTKDGIVLVDNNNATTVLPICTSLPSSATSTEDLDETHWIVQNQGRLALFADAVVSELELKTGTSLELNGLALTVGRLVVDGARFPIGTYTVVDSPLFTDALGTGEIHVVGSKHVTVLLLR